MAAVEKIGNDRNGKATFIVPSRWLAMEIEPLIERMNADMGDEVPFKNERYGAIQIIGDRAARYLNDGASPEAVVRRLYDVRKGKTRAFTASLAEAICDALDTSVSSLDVPTLPGTIDGAKEMVAAWEDVHETRLSPFERRMLARKLTRFTNGLLAGLDLDLDGFGAALAVGAFLQAFAPEPVEIAEAA